MAIIINDKEILQFIEERKLLPQKYQNLFLMKKKGHTEREIIIPRGDGSLFKIILRQNQKNILDFSLILGYMPPKSNLLFRLRRYNGKSHEHTNILEKEVFYDFHIHIATERYQVAGLKEDGYAIITNAFSDIHSAIKCFTEDCNIVLLNNNQPKLF